MENNLILVDTSILIDYFRKSDKKNSILVKLFELNFTFCISAITEYEIYCGANNEQLIFWKKLLDNIKVVPFDHKVVEYAVAINNELKKKRKQIDIADLFIASSALAHNFRFATLNKKHFERIDNLEIIN
jgi:tRNA(fMet)-specific endonuclease VapC